jgi:hypothetical protein
MSFGQKKEAGILKILKVEIQGETKISLKSKFVLKNEFIKILLTFFLFFQLKLLHQCRKKQKYFLIFF